MTNDSGFLTSHQSLSNYLDKSTEQTITASKIAKGNDVGWYADSTDGTQRIRFIIGGDGENRGMWDDRLQKWIVYANNTSCYLNGNCDYASSAGNSDTLDGYHEYSFLRNRGATSASGEGTLWTQIGIKEYFNALPDGLSGVYSWGEVVSFPGTWCRFDIYCSHTSSDGNGLYYRSGWGDDKKAWNRINVENATYLNGYQIYVG